MLNDLKIDSKKCLGVENPKRVYESFHRFGGAKRSWPSWRAELNCTRWKRGPRHNRVNEHLQQEPRTQFFLKGKRDVLIDFYFKIFNSQAIVIYQFLQKLLQNAKHNKMFVFCNQKSHFPDEAPEL